MPVKYTVGCTCMGNRQRRSSGKANNRKNTHQQGQNSNIISFLAHLEILNGAAG